MRLVLVAALVALVATPAGAASADEVAARAHYQAAQAYFEQSNFADALREYEVSYRLAPYPAILYKTGLCHEQLGQYAEAADTFEKYLALDPTAPRRAAVEASIVRLRERARPAPPERPLPAATTPPPAPAVRAAASPEPVEPPRRHRFVAPALVLASAAALAVAGAGLIGSVKVDYDQCVRPCSDGAISSMQSRAYAGYALFGLAGAAAIVDVILWVRAARHARAQGFAAVARF